MKSGYILLGLLALSLSISCTKEEPAPPEPAPVPINEAPEVPVQLLPTENEQCVPVDLQFKWKDAIDPENDRVFYKLEVSADDNFEDIIQSRQSEGPEVNLDLDPGQRLYWRVKAIDALHNESEFSSARTFYTEPDPGYNSIPQQPQQVQPGNGTTVTQNKVLLEWTASDADEDDLEYELYFGTEDPPQLMAESLEGTSMEISIESNKTYYWKVIVTDVHGGKAIGGLWYFKT